MKRVISEIKYWSQLFLLPLHGLSFLMPRDKHIWVLGSTFGQRFADNPKYFYLYLNQYQANQVRAIWISKSKEIVELLQRKHLESYYLYSVKGIWYSLRAKVYLFDNYSKDISYALSGRAIKINLWHGIPLKKIQKDNRFDLIRNPKNLGEKLYAIPRRISDEKASHYVLGTSEFMQPVYTSAFQTKNVIISGYPRNDILINENLVKNIFTQKEKMDFERLKNYKRNNYTIILYLPTFRESEMKFFDIIKIQEFCDYLKKEMMIFCVKLHPKSMLQQKFQEMNSDQIMICDSQSDPYPLLQLADSLVTDYSSIYFDYLLRNKPIIFFPYDYKEYLTNSRDLYFDYEEFTPGKKVYSMVELEEALLAEDIYQKQRNLLAQKVFVNPGEIAGEKLYHKIAKLI